jgi:hypothetical protein
MDNDPKDDPNKVVELAKARKQMQTLQAKEKNGRAGGSSNQQDWKNGKKRPGKNSPQIKKGFWDYVQLVFFLAMAAYMMHLCSGQGGI